MEAAVLPRDPLTILPYDAWPLVMAKVEDPDDLLNCSRACQLFQDILKPTESLWIFKKAFRHLFPYLNKKDILNCREVCRSWERTVDKFLGNHSYHTPFDPATSEIHHTFAHSPLVSRKLAWMTITKSTQIPRLMKVVGSVPKTFFFGRSLWLEFEEYDPDPEDENYQENSKFWPEVFKFLSFYGEHVQYFTFVTYGSNNPLRRFLDTFNRCLSYLPNLKSIYTFGSIAVDFNDDDLNYDSEVVEYLHSYPLPALEHLETVSIECFGGLPESFKENMVTRYQHTLKRIDIEITDWDPLLSNQNFNLPNLTEAHWTVQSVVKFENLVKRLTCPIGKLFVHMNYNCIRTSQDLARIFTCIGHFGATLIWLRIEIPPVFQPWEDRLEHRPKLEAPKLLALQLDGFCNNISIDFLLDLSSSLKYFHFRHFCRGEPLTSIQDEEIIDLHKIMSDNCQFYESNIWTKMTKLKIMGCKTFAIKKQDYFDHTYNRETYEYLQRKRTLAITNAL